MKLTLAGYLLVAVIALAITNLVTGYLWLTAGARCKADKAQAVTKAQEAAAEHYSKARDVASRIFDGTRADTAADLTDAAGSTSDRAVQIIRVPVTGGCTMPAGLPSLQPAVEEARRAARD